MFVTVFEDGSEKTWPLSSNHGPSDLGERFDIVLVQADGHELDHVLNQFTNIPGPNLGCKTRSFKWFGDTAKFIFNNLRGI